jgi:hypothetical protein
VIVDSQQDGLLRGFRLAPGAMREKSIVAPCLQMRIERLDAFFGRRLHHDSPTTIEGLLQQCRQNLLRRLPFEVIEKNFCHGDVRGISKPG